VICRKKAASVLIWQVEPIELEVPRDRQAADRQEDLVSWPGLVEKKWTFRPRDDAVHLALEDVDELRQVLYAAVPQKPPCRRHITLSRELCIPLRSSPSAKSIPVSPEPGDRDVDLAVV
jgi:hypothetical protein